MDRSITYPKFQAFDSSGVPLSGGLVYTYEAGLSTPKTTYVDRGLVTENTNPVILDSRGEALIFCSGTLKIILKDSTGAEIITVDGLKVTDTGTLADTDADTRIEVESIEDEDIIRLITAGTQRGQFDANGMTLALGVSVNEMSTDGTLAGNSDDAVPTEKAVKSYVDSYGVPTGFVMAWPTGTAPTGYLECNGASISRATYASLFAAIGVIYGTVDSNTFTLPDYRGRFLRGWDHAAALDPDAATRTDRGDTTTGDYVGTKQADGFKAHNHSISWGTAGSDSTYYQVSGATTGLNTTIITSTGGNETRPANINIMYCIKY